MYQRIMVHHALWMLILEGCNFMQLGSEASIATRWHRCLEVSARLYEQAGYHWVIAIAWSVISFVLFSAKDEIENRKCVCKMRRTIESCTDISHRD